MLDPCHWDTIKAMLSTMQLYRWICLGRRSCGACIALAERSSKLWACAVSREKVLRLRGPVAEVLASGGGPRFAAVFVGCQLTFPVTWQPSQSSHCYLALDHVHVSPRA